jgi:ATP-binding cassette subfamily C (CFTR/MRP) protein 1
MTRGGMVAAIYQKTLTLSVADANPAAAITLMSTDVERISGGSSHLQETWANTIEVGIALYLIERQLGVACLIPLFSALGISLLLLL